MGHLLSSYPITSIWRGASLGQHYGGFGGVACYGVGRKTVPLKSTRQRCSGVKCFCSPTDQKLRLVQEVEVREKRKVSDCLVSAHGWRVRRLVEEADEMKEVAFIQAQSFHVPVALFDDYFFEFFQAEVLSGLIYKLKNSAPDRYACLVAEPGSNDSSTSPEGLVGVVDVTALRDYDVLRHLQGADEYLYISGLAVLKSFRRRKIATVLLQACEALSILWGFQYLALRAYEDDEAAQQLYTNAGYRIVAGDPPWFSTWIGRRRRVVMIKSSAHGHSRDPSL